MAEQLISIALLLLIFVIGTLRPINLGVLALVAAFAMGYLVLNYPAADVPSKVLAGFPANIFVLLLGVTFLFGIASVNGTIDRVVQVVARATREHRALMPWVIFVIATIPTNAGAAGPAAIALLAPIAMRMAARYELSARMAALMVINGADAGNFSPLNVLGVIVNGTLAKQHLEVSHFALWAGNFVFNVMLGVVAYLLCGGLRLLRDRHAHIAGDNDEAMALDEADERRPGLPTWQWVATLVAIVVVAAGALVFDLDIGGLALAAAVVLALLMPTVGKEAFTRVSWSTIALICGVVTYVGLMQAIGTVDMIGDKVTQIASALLAAFLLALTAAVVSAFASSIAILGVLIPLSVPFLATGQVSVTGLVIAIAIAATVVDATPFSSVGALTVASAPAAARERLSRDLIRWGFAMVVIAPVLTWLAFVLPLS
jgi:Na+/H+ antiporter NhaD/arsenite permease-like protein